MLGKFCTLQSQAEPLRAMKRSVPYARLCGQLICKNIAMVPPNLMAEVASTGFCVLNPADEIDHRFIFYALRATE